MASITGDLCYAATCIYCYLLCSKTPKITYMPNPVKFDKIDPKFESRERIVSERKPGFH